MIDLKKRPEKMTKDDLRIVDQAIRLHDATFTRLAIEIIELIDANPGLGDKVKFIKAGISSGYSLGVHETEEKLKKAETPN